MEKTTKTQRVIAIVLAAIFIPMIAVGGIYGVISNHTEIGKSVLFSHAKKYLSNRENPEFFEMTSARIQSLESELGAGIPLKDELGYFNASFQYTLGKEMVLQGNEQIVSLDHNQLYALTTTESLQDQADEVVRFYERVKDRCPFLFSYIQPQFFIGGDPLPDDYKAIDTGDMLADQVLDTLRAAGAETLDSREFFVDYPQYTTDDLQLKTDMHWTTLAALLAARTYAEEINRLMGTNLDVSKLDIENFETETYEDLFLGEYGQQVGVENSGLDDITLYWPKEDSQFQRITVNRDGTEESAQGGFRDAVIHWDAFDTEPDGTNISGYIAYGLIERYEEIINSGDCEDMTLMIFKDSYTAPIGAFLSLLVKDVVMVDMRTAQQSAMDYVEQVNPDMIIFSYSRQMYEDHNYTLDD